MGGVEGEIAGRWIVWGGHNMATGQMASDGASYDPATNSWAPLSAVPTSFVSRLSPWIFKTYYGLFVWGGTVGSARLGDGAILR